MSGAKQGGAAKKEKSSGSLSSLEYNCGFGNHFSTEALPGALPVGQNNPQRCPYDLYAEQISGTAFTAPRNNNRRTWFYRLRPSVVQKRYKKAASQPFQNNFASFSPDPSQMRWQPLAVPSREEKEMNFVEGIITVGGHGDPTAKAGLGIYTYLFNTNMSENNQSFTNADGEMLIVPQQGPLKVTTEMGVLEVAINEIVVIPRGVKFCVDLQDVSTGGRGYMLELFEGHFVLPDLGPIGANCLANPRDFEAPVAAFSDSDGDYSIFTKFAGQLFKSDLDHCPFDVVAWHGNLTPYKYDLRKFITINSVSKDHPDPSIYTVLTCPSSEPGVAVADFVIFPPRWMVMEDSFRPPWYHRNTMSEFMGMVWGSYDAKAGGFVPGGSSLHNCMTPHGPDATTFEKASTATLEPHKFEGGLAFMFETKYQLKVTDFQQSGDHREVTYPDCWATLQKKFQRSKL